MSKLLQTAALITALTAIALAVPIGAGATVTQTVNADSGPADIVTKDIGRPTALIMQRIAGLPEPPEPQSDGALAEVGRVVLRIAVASVTAVNYLPAYDSV